MLSTFVRVRNDSIIGRTIDGAITAWSRGAENVFGYSAAETVGQSMRMLIPPEPANEETDILARIGRGERVDHFEAIQARKDGKGITGIFNLLIDL